MAGLIHIAGRRFSKEHVNVSLGISITCKAAVDRRLADDVWYIKFALSITLLQRLTWYSITCEDRHLHLPCHLRVAYDDWYKTIHY